MFKNNNFSLANLANSSFSTATNAAGLYSLTNAGDPAPAPAPAGGNPYGLPEQAAAGFQTMLTKMNNDAIAVAAHLYDDNYRQRVQIRELSAKMPEGSIVLTAEQAKDWQIYAALNMKAADVKKAIESVATLEQANRELSTLETLRTVADLGLDGSKLDVDVLADQLKLKYPEAKITFQEIKVEGQDKPAKVAYIQKTDKDPVTKFEDFAKADLAKYLPALKVSSEANNDASTVAPGNTGDPAPHNTASSLFDNIRNEVAETQKTGSPVNALEARFGRGEQAIAQ